MAERRQLAHPPIKEALLNIQISPTLAPQFAKTLEAQWPATKKQPIYYGRVQVQVGIQFESKGSNELFGFRCDSDDGRTVTQVRRDGVTFSIVRDYETWEELEARTIEVWSKFLDLAGPVTVSKIATRFINVFKMPAGEIEFTDYFTAAPRVPPGLPQITSQFFQSIMIPVRSDTNAIVIQALDAPNTEAVSVILDIDVQLSCTTPGELRGVQPQINSLRKLKNDVFFSSVTERVLEGY